MNKKIIDDIDELLKSWPKGSGVVIQKRRESYEDRLAREDAEDFAEYWKVSDSTRARLERRQDF